MKRTIVHAPGARRDRQHVPPKVLERIDSAIAEYAEDPRSARNVKRLRGHKGQLRIRVGDWRVIIEDDGRTVCVLAIRTRGDAYRP